MANILEIIEAAKPKTIEREIVIGEGEAAKTTGVFVSFAALTVEDTIRIEPLFVKIKEIKEKGNLEGNNLEILRDLYLQVKDSIISWRGMTGRLLDTYGFILDIPAESPQWDEEIPYSVEARTKISGVLEQKIDYQMFILNSALDATNELAEQKKRS